MLVRRLLMALLLCWATVAHAQQPPGGGVPPDVRTRLEEARKKVRQAQQQVREEGEPSPVPAVASPTPAPVASTPVPTASTPNPAIKAVKRAKAENAELRRQMKELLRRQDAFLEQQERKEKERKEKEEATTPIPIRPPPPVSVAPAAPKIGPWGPVPKEVKGLRHYDPRRIFFDQQVMMVEWLLMAMVFAFTLGSRKVKPWMIWKYLKAMTVTQIVSSLGRGYIYLPIDPARGTSAMTYGVGVLALWFCLAIFTGEPDMKLFRQTGRIAFQSWWRRFIEALAIDIPFSLRVLLATTLNVTVFEAAVTPGLRNNHLWLLLGGAGFGLTASFVWECKRKTGRWYSGDEFLRYIQNVAVVQAAGAFTRAVLYGAVAGRTELVVRFLAVGGGWVLFGWVVLLAFRTEEVRNMLAARDHQKKGAADRVMKLVQFIIDRIVDFPRFFFRTSFSSSTTWALWERWGFGPNYFIPLEPIWGGIMLVIFGSLGTLMVWDQRSWEKKALAGEPEKEPYPPTDVGPTPTPNGNKTT